MWLGAIGYMLPQHSTCPIPMPVQRWLVRLNGCCSPRPNISDSLGLSSRSRGDSIIRSPRTTLQTCVVVTACNKQHPRQYGWRARCPVVGSHETVRLCFPMAADVRSPHGGARSSSLVGVLIVGTTRHCSSGPRQQLQSGRAGRCARSSRPKAVAPSLIAKAERAPNIRNGLPVDCTMVFIIARHM